MVEHAQLELGGGAQADPVDRMAALHLADQREGAVERARARIAHHDQSWLAVHRDRAHDIAFVAEAREIEVERADMWRGGGAEQDRAAVATVMRGALLPACR